VLCLKYPYRVSSSPAPSSDLGLFTPTGPWAVLGLVSYVILASFSLFPVCQKVLLLQPRLCCRSSRPSKSLVQQFIDTPKFAPDDIRKVCRLQRAEVDVSFALCVGGISSPELCIFSSEAIMEQLGSAAGKYCDDNVEVNSLQGVVTLPQQFEWYSADFGGTDAKLLSFVCRQLSGSKQKALLSLSQTSARLGKVLVIQYREFRFDFSYSVQAVDLKSSVSSPEKDSDWEPLTQQGPALGTHMSMSAPSHSRSLAETQSAPYRL